MRFEALSSLPTTSGGQLAAEGLPGVVILGEIGRGGQSVVYRVRRNGVDLAMKVLLQAPEADRQGRVSFRREAALLAVADHPGLAAVHDVGEVDGRPYLIMELIEGAELATVLQRGPLPEDRIITLGIEVADILAAVHRVGLVHRDINPNNILVQPDGSARLIDLGMAARAAPAIGDAVTGTLKYASPEQVGTLKRPVDRRSDLYSLGVVLFECAAGQPPFHSPDVGELLRMHACVAPPDLRTLRRDLAPALVAVVGRLLAKDPDNRYADCAVLQADLRAIAADRDRVSEPARRAGTGPTPTELPLVGRDSELEALTGQWHRVRTGHGALALLRGGPGSGKSRLATHFCDRLVRDGVPVLTGACVDGAPPLAALAGAVERFIDGINRLDDERAATATQWVRAAAGAAAPYLRRLTPALAALLADVADAPDDQPEGFVRAVAGFLVELAGAAGGAVVMIDDVQGMDGATARVLHQVMVQLPEAPLLLVAVVEDDGTDRAPSFTPAVAVDLDLSLGPLRREALVALVTFLAGRLHLDPDLLERIVARSGGTPLGALEYLSAVLDAGLIVPRWGSWVFDADGLDHVDRPADSLGLLVRRIDNLGERGRQLLTAAATIGVRFPPALPARIDGVPPDEAARLFDAAVAAGVLERRPGGLAFVHDRVRRALLDATAVDRLRDLHQRAAEILARQGPDGPAAPDGPAGPDGSAEADSDAAAAHRYALARHYMSGHPDRDPAAVFAACVRAGQRALVDHAATEAVEYFEFAQAYAGPQPPAAHSALYESLGTAFHLASRFGDAEAALDEALVTAPDAVTRARILEQRGRLQLATWRLDAAVDTARQGLAELGRPLPTNPVWLAVTTAAMVVAGVFVGRTGIGFGTTDPVRLANYRLLASLYMVAGHSAVRMLSPGLAIILSLRRRYIVGRIGVSLELVTSAANSACLVQLVQRRANRRGFARAARLAARFGHPAGIAYTGYTQRVADMMTQQPAAGEHLRWLKRHEPLLDAGHCLDFRHSWCNRLLLDGRSAEALAVYEQGVVRLTGDDYREHPYAQLGHAVAAATGRTVDARHALRPLKRHFAAFRNLGGRVNMLTSSAILAVEQCEYGETFDRIAAEFAALRINPLVLLPTLRPIYVALAYGRLEQCRHATGAGRERALAAAAGALRNLRRTAAGGGVGPHLRAHHRVGRAHLCLLRGQVDQALDQLIAADRLLRHHDVPLATFEAARVRARALTALGRTDAAVAQVTGAIALAEQLGWPHRAEWVRTEFRSALSSRPASAVSPGSAGFGADRRRLEALEQLSATAARILDPDELTRVALDETIRILAAERAYLFLVETKADAAADGATGLLPHLGRDAAGRDLEILTDYGSTVVERVRQRREPVIVTGTEDGMALGSRSVVVHNLRSIMAAPLQFDGRLLGVVYLDSRLAKGMFTAADVGILAAITNHIAAALETARAAQLAVAVRAAERQRDVANKLREAMADISGSLDPADVLHRLHRALARMLPGTCSCLVRVGGNGLTVTPGTDPAARPLPLAAVPDLSRILAADFPVIGVGGTAELLSSPGCVTPAADGSWLAVPLRHRDRLIGAIVVGARGVGAYTAADAQLAAVIAGEGMLAFDNAQLFAQVQVMATTDVLTEVSNRRHFLTLAERDVAQAAGRPGPMTAIMLDIDHFKRVNDEYGHRVGDQVIRAVAQRLRRTLRAADRLGRYGGEEFAILLGDRPADPLELSGQLCGAIAGVAIDTDAGRLPVTISVGVRVFDPARQSLAEALDAADAALYRAKKAGRNRVVVSRD